jgi:predicted Fe-Mo cluster-binding NifX family protein
MDGFAHNLSRQMPRIALLVMGSSEAAALCPFFGKCDGFVLVAPDGRPAEFHVNADRTADSLCDLVIESGATAVICGFIGENEKRKLAAAGIDVRMGSCVCSVEELATCFDELPHA